MRRFAALTAACALIAAGPVLARPFTVNDLLAREQLGSLQIDAGQRWLVVQHFAPWDTAARYDLDADTALGLSRIQVFDLAHGGAERSMGLDAEGTGYVPGPLSPDGRRLAVYRVSGHDVELGVVDLVQGQVRWLALTPRLPGLGRVLAWRDATTLVAATRPPQAVDGYFGWGWIVQSRLPPLWAAAARGEAAVSVVGSGRWAVPTPRTPIGAIVSVDVVTGAQQTLGGADVLDMEIAPGGGALVVLVPGRDLPVPASLARVDEPPKQRRLLLFDLATGARSAPLGERDVMARLLSWSASGRQLLVFARDPALPWSQGGYWRVAASGGAKPLPLDGKDPALGGSAFGGALARGAWLGEAPAVPLRSGGRIDWWRVAKDGAATNLTARGPSDAKLLAAGRDGLLLGGQDRLWRVTPRGLVALPLGAKARFAHPSDLGDRGAYEPAALDGVAIEARGRSATVTGAALPTPDVDETLALAAPRRGQAIVTERDAHGVEQVRLRSTGGARALVTINARLADVDFAQAQPVHYKGIDGEALTSWLYLPPGADDDHRPPLVVIPYPGQATEAPPRAQAPPAANLIVNGQILVGQGYAVLVPALPYRQGREPTEGLADQILAAVDAAAAIAPIDARHPALYGHSYGGYAAVAAATQSDRFGAVIAASATTNLFSAYGRQPPAAYAAPENGLTIGTAVGWLETGQVRMGAAPWSDPERYARNSPLTHADRITAPVLMLYGDLDNDVTQPQGFFAALFRQNKDAQLAIYRGESHVPLSPGNVRDLHARVLAFLRATIGPGLPLP